MPEPLLAEDSIRSLTQAVDLLEALDDETYARKVPECFGGWIGAHVRHVHDHYLRLLDGLPNGAVDYDLRERDPRFETDRSHALERLRQTLAALEALDAGDADRPLRVRTAGRVQPREDEWCGSTVARELLFLTLHDVHHYALVAFMLATFGRETPKGFGMAPSTIRYLESRR